MVWIEYKRWLDENILAWEGEYLVLNQLAEKKYQSNSLRSGGLKCLVSLEDFYNSLNATLNDDLDYHHLPLCESNEAISWDELFPDWHNTYFGKKSKKELLAWDIYSKLKEIYEDWRAELEEVESNQGDEWWKGYNEDNFDWTKGQGQPENYTRSQPATQPDNNLNIPWVNILGIGFILLILVYLWKKNSIFK